jgi:peptidoglycan/xylan/chitin deacetylase (PgdA/CDA1 family)
MMPYWKQLLLTSYYHGTIPLRRHRQYRATQSGRAPVAILIFHRIADDDANEWTTPTATFCRAIDWLQRHFDLISLDEAQGRIKTETSDRPGVAITFDDGYAVNCRVALPLLVERQIPCTYFVTTQPVLDQVGFEHDVRMGNNFAPNTVEQLKALADSGVEIGAHTRTHADLGQVSEADRLFDEMITSTRDLEAAIGRDARYFAFPFGRHENLSAAAFHLARDAGFAGVCSAYGGYNYPGDDPFHLQRCGVDGTMARLRNWVTIDPLRNRMIRRFQYQSSDAQRAPTMTGVPA